MASRLSCPAAAVLLVLVCAAPLRAQTPSPPPDRLRVFLDCQFQCDLDYLRQNVGFVDYMRDRTDADLHVLVTTQATGSGGTSWTLKFIGLGRFQGHDHTYTFATGQVATSDDQRREFVRVFKLGLVDYSVDTSAMGQLDVLWRRPGGAVGPPAAVAGPQKDPWNYWVFRTSAGGNGSGERLSSSRSYRLSFSANRVTEQWKVNLSGSKSTNRSSYVIEDSPTIKTKTESWSLDGLVVRSLGPKWSFGTRAAVSRSSYSNTDRSLNIAPGIEFDFFPYAESTRRSLTLMYTLSATRYTYRELTVYDKLRETVPAHSLSASLGLRQPWGSVGASASFSQHLNHADRWNTSFFGSTDVRLFKGFSFNVFGSYSKIKDQISLRKGGATRDEILLRLRQLATNYSYHFSVGISYSFGSIFNNVVNPRFGGGGGGMHFVIFE